jgi:hypothetical protein
LQKTPETAASPSEGKINPCFIKNLNQLTPALSVRNVTFSSS